MISKQNINDVRTPMLFPVAYNTFFFVMITIKKKQTKKNQPDR